MNTSISFLFLSGLFLLLCANDMQAQAIIPLHVGNHWVYEKASFHAGSVIARDTVTNSVNNSVQVAGNTWYVIQEFGDEFLIRNTPEGQVELDTLAVNAIGDYTEVLMFRFPRRKPFTYRVYDLNLVTVDSKKHKVKNPDQTFRCYRYEIVPIDSEVEKIEVFIHPGIGIISHKRTTGEQEETHTLLEYTLR